MYLLLQASFFSLSCLLASQIFLDCTQHFVYFLLMGMSSIELGYVKTITFKLPSQFQPLFFTPHCCHFEMCVHLKPKARRSVTKMEFLRIYPSWGWSYLKYIRQISQLHLSYIAAIYNYMQVCKYMHVCNYASTQVCKCASICKYACMQTKGKSQAYLLQISCISQADIRKI